MSSSNKFNALIKIIYFLIWTLLFMVLLSCSNPAIENIEETKNVMLIQLDDRPINQYVPRQLAIASGMELILPPNNFESDQLADWIMTYPDPIHGYIFSIDMLAYGGLVPSRKLQIEKESAVKRLSIISKLKEKFPERQIYAFSTIPRLTITVEQEEDLSVYEQIRKWSILGGKDNITEEEKQELERLAKEIPSHLLKEYIEVRERNLEINREVLLFLEQDYIDYLLIGQDDAAREGIHLQEKQLILKLIHQLHLEDKVILLDGADELDLLLITRLKSSFSEISPSFHIYYTGIDGSEWTAPLEGQALEHNLEAHLKAAGATWTATANDADIQLIIHTPLEENDLNGGPEQIEPLSYLFQQFQYIAIADVAELNKADSAFMESLLQAVHPTNLLSYSSWNTASNTLGIVIAQASARYSFLQQEENLSEDLLISASEAHLQLLFHRFAKDYLYKTILYPDLKKFCHEIGVSPYDLQDQYLTVNAYVDHKVTNMATQFYNTYFHGQIFQVGSEKGQVLDAIIVGLEDIHVQIPWNRIFEAEIEPQLTIEILNDNKE